MSAWLKGTQGRQACFRVAEQGIADSGAEGRGWWTENERVRVGEWHLDEKSQGKLLARFDLPNNPS